jgi:ATP-dependent DNA helicase RecG
MKENGSPDPVFKTDDDRSYFQVTLFIHPYFLHEKMGLREQLRVLKENSLFFCRL